MLDLIFDEGETTDNIPDNIYKISLSDYPQKPQYMKDGSFLKELPIDGSVVTFNASSIDTTIGEYVYSGEGGSWLYPNESLGSDYSLCANSDLRWYANNEQCFPLYHDYTEASINKTSHASYPIYEKTAEKINYMYKNNSNSLKFIFTDKDISGVLAACGLPNSISKYVHLTNLEYNDK